MPRIIFADMGSWDYTPATVLAKPLGGTHSAACYLAIALADAGHEVRFLSNTSQPGRHHGVDCLSWNAASPAELAALAPDLVIAIHEPAFGVRLRGIFGPSARIVAWTGNAYTPSSALARKLQIDDALWALDGVALVSEWQRRHFVQALAYPMERTCLLRYAVAPAFENLFPPGRAILPQKSAPPVLAYTSTPFRGLDALALAFPEIRRRVPGTRLQVFSSMQVYLDFAPWADHATHGPLYAQLRRTPGVEYHGSVAQPALAAHMRQVQVLAYPNTFEETFCIAALEAMAGGCQVVTSDYGALPETTAGFADLFQFKRDAPVFLHRFIEATVAALQRARQQPAQTEVRLRQQVDYISARFTWRKRAAELLPMVHALPPADLRRTAVMAGKVQLHARQPSGRANITYNRKS